MKTPPIRETETAPSQEPCAYCGARPTWKVEHRFPNGDVEVIYLCASCDEEEIQAIDKD